MMICDRRTVLALMGSAAFVSTASAKHNHHSGPQLLGGRLNTNGTHEIHKVGEHTVHVHVQNKKVASVSVMHRTKGNVAVKKYKTNRKMAQGSDIDAPVETTGRLIKSAGYQLAQAAGLYIGYSFTGHRRIYLLVPGRHRRGPAYWRSRLRAGGVKFGPPQSTPRDQLRGVWFARIRSV